MRVQHIVLRLFPYTVYMYSHVNRPLIGFVSSPMFFPSFTSILPYSIGIWKSFIHAVSFVTICRPLSSLDLESIAVDNLILVSSIKPFHLQLGCMNQYMVTFCPLR